MGMNKRFIDKDIILYYLRNENIKSLDREVKINQLLNAELLVLDNWSSRFYNDLNPDERKIRRDLYERYKFDSGISFLQDTDLEKLNSLSETLLSLCGDTASWIDIHLVINKLKIKVDSDDAGKYSILKDKCIESIIEYFGK